MLVTALSAAVVLYAWGGWHAAFGEWRMALACAVMAVAAAAAGIHVLHGGKADAAGAVVALVLACWVLFPAYLSEHRVLLLSFPFTVLMFFVMQPEPAFRLAVLLVLALLPAPALPGSWSDRLLFAGTALLNLALVAHFVSSAQERRMHLLSRVERDALTGVGNRHALEPALVAALDARRFRGVPATLLVIDFDHFKQVNDTFGHQAGDAVLRELTRLISRNIRAGDRIFRYGGEELVVLANGASLEPGGCLAENLRQEIRRAVVHPVGHVSVSIGVAEACADDSPHSWFDRADRCMYCAKTSGRDRVVAGAGHHTHFNDAAA